MACRSGRSLFWYQRTHQQGRQLWLNTPLRWRSRPISGWSTPHLLKVCQSHCGLSLTYCLSITSVRAHVSRHAIALASKANQRLIYTSPLKVCQSHRSLSLPSLSELYKCQNTRRQTQQLWPGTPLRWHSRRISGWSTPHLSRSASHIAVFPHLLF